MISYRRRVHFEDVDAAGIVFFARYLNFCHEAMENFFTEVEGGYAGMITVRRVGLPAVHIEIDYTLPLRYGNAVDIETDVTHIGNSSVTLRYRFVMADTRKSVAVIVQEHLEQRQPDGHRGAAGERSTKESTSCHVRAHESCSRRKAVVACSAGAAPEEDPPGADRNVSLRAMARNSAGMR